MNNPQKKHASDYFQVTLHASTSCYGLVYAYTVDQVLHLFSKHKQTSQLPGPVVSGQLEHYSLLVLFEEITLTFFLSVFRDS